MDPTLVAAFGQVAQANAARQAKDVADTASLLLGDQRAVTAGIFRLIAQASDPASLADLNTSSHAPISNPYWAPAYTGGATVKPS